MRSRLRRGFTLVEILVVVAVLTVLAALLFPVVARAKLSSQRASCASNLKQCAVALSLYLEENDGTYPAATFFDGKIIRSTSAITAHTAPMNTFRCPLDRKEGRGFLPLADRREPRSYSETWFLWEGRSGVEAWKELLTVEPNPILFRCYFHDDRVRGMLLSPENLSSKGAFNNGLAQVVRKDGSVALDRRADIIDAPTGDRLDVKRSIWSLATTQPCPATICDGKDPEEGQRED